MPEGIPTCPAAKAIQPAPSPSGTASSKLVDAAIRLLPVPFARPSAGAQLEFPGKRQSQQLDGLIAGVDADGLWVDPPAEHPGSVAGHPAEALGWLVSHHGRVDDLVQPTADLVLQPLGDLAFVATVDPKYVSNIERARAWLAFRIKPTT